MDIAAILREFGLPIAIIFALCLVVIALVRHIVTLYERLFTIQEARRLEGLETAKELNITLHTFSESTKMLVDKIKFVRGDKE